MAARICSIQVAQEIHQDLDGTGSLAEDLPDCYAG